MMYIIITTVSFGCHDMDGQSSSLRFARQASHCFSAFSRTKGSEGMKLRLQKPQAPVWRSWTPPMARVVVTRPSAGGHRVHPYADLRGVHLSSSVVRHLQGLGLEASPPFLCTPDDYYKHLAVRLTSLPSADLCSEIIQSTPRS